MSDNLPPREQAGEHGPVTRLAIFEGGVILVTRQLFGYCLKVIGLLLVTRVLGPAHYAPYVAALSLVNYAIGFITDGMNGHLVLGGDKVTERQEATVYSLLAIASALIVAIILAAVHPIANWIGLPEAAGVMEVLAFFVPFRLLMIPSFARLERALDYRSVAVVELGSQVAFYAVAAPLVIGGLGPAGMAFGMVAQYVVSFILGLRFTHTRPRFGFDRDHAAAAVRFGLSYSLVSWTWQLRALVNPLVVAPLLGAEAVGLVGMTNTVVELAAFVKNIVYRIMLAVLGRYRDDTSKMREAITHGMQGQTLAVGAVLLGFGWFAGYLVPLVFGARWLPLLQLYPFVALGFLANAQFNVHSAVLIAFDRHFDVVLFHVAHVVLFVGTAALLIPHVGITGYGWGEVAAIPAYVLLHLFAMRRVGSPDYLVGMIWIVGAGLGLFWREIGAWAILAPFIALATPPSIALIRGHVAEILIQRRRRAHA